MELLEYNRNILKANTDLSNTELSDEFIDEVFRGMCPNYSAAYNVAFGSALNDYGYVHATTMVYYGGIAIYMNGLRVGYWVRISQYNAQIRNTCSMLPAKPGDVLTIDGDNRGATCLFYPLVEPFDADAPKTKKYNVNSLVADAQLDNSELTQEFFDRLFLALTPTSSGAVILASSQTVETTYTVVDCGYINVWQERLDEGAAFHIYINNIDVNFAHNPGSYYWSATSPQYMVKPGDIVRITGGASNSAITVYFMPLRRRG